VKLHLDDGCAAHWLTDAVARIARGRLLRNRGIGAREIFGSRAKVPS
jgi:hypothetical protein